MNLAAEMAKLPEPPNDSAPPLWDAWRHDLWTRAQVDDARNFHRWPAVYHTMLVDHWWPEPMGVECDYVWQRTTPPVLYGEQGINIIQSSVAWSQDELDNPRYAQEIFTAIDNLINASPDLRNLVHQAYHILRWQEATGQSIADMQSIYEFGGGYGAMALVCNRLGFRGQYYIYDLPEFGLLQRWYLGECGVDNVAWVDSESYGDVDLMIACYSLSETDYAERGRILKAWGADSYLFLYSNKFEQFDNIEYFQGLEYGEFAKHWRHERIDHLPPESWYSWGWCLMNEKSKQSPPNLREVSCCSNCWHGESVSYDPARWCKLFDNVEVLPYNICDRFTEITPELIDSITHPDNANKSI